MLLGWLVLGLLGCLGLSSSARPPGTEEHTIRFDGDVNIGETTGNIVNIGETTGNLVNIGETTGNLGKVKKKTLNL